MATSVLKIDILADVRKAVDGIDRVAGKVDGFSSTLGKIGKGVATAFAAGAILDFAAGAAAAADESAKVQRVTDQLVKSTGAAAGVTADQIGALATSISNMTAVDDELIQQSANVLLTFKNVKKAGEGVDDVFARATAAGVDLAAAGFGEPIGNAKMLGKALNDPIAGLSALSRAGVTFTAQQKEQIATLTETGDLLGAQKIILAEVESQVGGAASAAASSMDRLKVAFGNAQESIGGALLPVIDEVLPLLMDVLDELVPAVKPVMAAFAGLARTFVGAVLPALKPLFPVIAQLAAVIGQQLSRVIEKLAPVLPVLTGALAKVFGAIAPLIPSVVDLVVALVPLIPPLARIISLAANLAATLLSKLSPVISGVARVLSGFASAIGWVVDKVATLIGWVFDLIDALSNPVLDTIGSIVGGIGSVLPWSAAPAGAVAAGRANRALTPRAAAPSITVVAGLGADALAIGPTVVDVLKRYERRNGNWNRVTPGAGTIDPGLSARIAAIEQSVQAVTDQIAQVDARVLGKFDSTGWSTTNANPVTLPSVTRTLTLRKGAVYRAEVVASVRNGAAQTALTSTNARLYANGTVIAWAQLLWIPAASERSFVYAVGLWTVPEDGEYTFTVAVDQSLGTMVNGAGQFGWSLIPLDAA